MIILLYFVQFCIICWVCLFSECLCLDAQICLLGWVSFGLEPATDGSGRFAHLLHRDGSRTQGLRLRRRRRLSPPAPSAGRRSGRPGATSPRTGAEVGYAPARAGGHSPVWGAGPPASGGSRLLAGARPGGSAGPFRAPSGLHDYRDCRPGGGSLRPVRRRSHHTVCRRPCRAAVTTIVRAGAGAPCSPEWSSLRLTAAGRAEYATSCRAGSGAPCSPEASLGRLSASWPRGIRDW